MAAFSSLAADCPSLSVHGGSGMLGMIEGGEACLPPSGLRATPWALRTCLRPLSFSFPHTLILPLCVAFRQ